MMLSDFHEVWWIYSDAKENWAGLHLAHFRKVDDLLVVVIPGEIDPQRIGVRIWEDIKFRERWIKVWQIAIPTQHQIREAMEDWERNK